MLFGQKPLLQIRWLPGDPVASSFWAFPRTPWWVLRMTALNPKRALKIRSLYRMLEVHDRDHNKRTNPWSIRGSG